MQPDIKVRKTYSQNWPAYNLAQTQEKQHFLKLLRDLCAGVESEPQAGAGRPRLAASDIIFSVCYKIYSGLSGRRFMTDLRSAQEDGYIIHAPHFNSLFNCLENAKLTEILKQLIIKTSLPLKAIETDFAVDSSGFTTARHVSWIDYRYGKDKEATCHDWVKVHIMCGVKTNIITTAEILGKHTHDTVPFPDLVYTTGDNFKINEVSADKAYASGYNHNVVERHGGTPFIAFKSNNKRGTSNDMWAKMYHYFKFNEEEFMRHYHKRSNVEATFSMIKRKFGETLRSRTKTAQINEVLCKIVCHNICCLIHETIELGVDIDLSAT